METLVLVNKEKGITNGHLIKPHTDLDMAKKNKLMELLTLYIMKERKELSQRQL